MGSTDLGGKLQSVLGEWFKRLPALPPSAVDALFTIAPWLALVFGILGVLGALSGLGVLTAFAPFAMWGGVNFYGVGIISTVGWLVSSALMLLAFPGLRTGKLSGWNLLFWSEVVSVAASLLVVSVGSIIGALIGFYLLYQVKPKYK